MRKEEIAENLLYPSLEFQIVTQAEPDIDEENKQELENLPLVDIVCPRCSCNNYRKAGFTKRRKREQQYYCKTCKHYFILNPKYKQLYEKDSAIICHHCGSNNYTKAGHGRRNKQNYLCRDCHQHFIADPEWQPLKVPEKFDFCNDVWAAEQIGIKVPEYQYKTKFNFACIKQEWLKILIKKFILYSASNREFGTLSAFILYFKHFSEFLSTELYVEGINDLNRQAIINFLSYLNQRKFSADFRARTLSLLAGFIKTGVINKWFNVESYLIRKEDFPRIPKPLPRYIPDEVVRQLNQHLDTLPEPIMRAVLVIQECGLRIGELCLLPLDCLKQDSKGGWFIQFMRYKMKKESTLPISQALAEVIKEQQAYIQYHFDNNFQYLFCTRKRGHIFIPVPYTMSNATFTNYLKKLAVQFNIKDNLGKPWNFHTHQFRHTVATRMINNGVPQHIVQRYLGHESSEMTMRYAHIHDETLKKEIEKFHESTVVNFQGQKVELEETILSTSEDLEWFKKNIQARALEHGYCGRPKMLGGCDIPGFDGCYNCPHWRTNINFLPILKDTLERTNKVIEKARNCGWELQLQKNEPIQRNLEKVIFSLEAGKNEEEH
jgi:integrase/transposase-like protein